MGLKTNCKTTVRPKACGAAFHFDRKQSAYHAGALGASSSIAQAVKLGSDPDRHPLSLLRQLEPNAAFLRFFATVSLDSASESCTLWPPNRLLCRLGLCTAASSKDFGVLLTLPFGASPASAGASRADAFSGRRCRCLVRRGRGWRGLFGAW